MKRRMHLKGLVKAGILFLLWVGRLPFKMAVEKRQRRRSEPRTVSRAMRDFATVNAAAWRIDEIQGNDSRQRVLIEGLNSHKAYLMVNLIVGSHLMRVYGYAGAALLHEPDTEIETMFRSYGINEFHYLSDRDLSLSGRLRAGLAASRMVAASSGMDDLLQQNTNGVYIGKCVYDWYLRGMGAGTVESCSVLFLAKLATAIGYAEYASKLFSGGRFPVVVQAERQFVPEGPLFQTALARGSVVYCRGGGPTSFTVHRFDTPARAYCNTHRYGEALFEHVWRNHRETAVEAGGRFMEDRFSGNVRRNDIPDASLAYAANNELDRGTLCQRFGWDPAKPMVAVMSNMLNDGVFTNRWSLFRDNFTWLEETVRAIAAIDTVNWFVKAHPSDQKNAVKITGRHVYEKWAGNSPHVGFYPNEWGNRALPRIVDAVLTAHGSAGLEYSCLGIPCVLGGESLYSGLGFTHEPKTPEEYFETLRNIHTLGRLEPEQVERAKVFAYIYMTLSRVESRILPDVSVYADYDDDTYLRDAARLVQKFDPLDERLGALMPILVRQGYRHLLHYDRIGLDVPYARPTMPDVRGEGAECR